MANKINSKKIKEMFEAYCERQSINHVVKKCNISHVTVERYKILERWDERLFDIQQEQKRIENLEIAKVKAENLKYVRKLKTDLMKKVIKTKKTDYNKLDKAIDNLVRLELLLMGEADGRTENKQDVNITVQFGSDIDFNKSVKKTKISKKNKNSEVKNGKSNK